MINILFVDDEPTILEGMQHIFRSMRRDWQMYFVSSGVEALDILSKNRIDVIVSDMKMPVFDGTKLLSEVLENFPQVIRIILSGFSEKEMIIKSVGVTHQYMAKPCNPELLKTTVKRICALRDLLTDERLRRLVSQMPAIPSLPTLYSELLDELKKPEPSTKAVGNIVKKDIGMTVKILQIVNSALFGLRRRISDSNEAVEFVGLDTISSLTLGLGVITQFENQGVSAQTLGKIWDHSLKVGALAGKIAHRENPIFSSDAFTGGLLHDIGEVVLAVNLPEQFLKSRQIMRAENISSDEAEKFVFDSTHAEIGAYLLGLWGLPTGVVEAVAFHHQPSISQADSFSALAAVHIANSLAAEDSSEFERSNSPLDAEYLAQLELSEKIFQWQEEFSLQPA